MRTIDFDIFRAEQKDEGIDFIIGGEHYALPASLPASVAVDTIRMKAQMDDDDEVAIESLDSFGRSVFGPTVWEALLTKHRITINELEPLISRVMEAYTEGPKEETEDQTSATEPSSSTSSKTGPGSRPTSSGSTGSTSRKSSTA